MKKMLELAIKITEEAFENKTDVGGKSFILHCKVVMNAVRHLGDEVLCAAVMHNLVEDTDYSFAQLASLGFNENIVQLLKLLTHSKNEDYGAYISIISASKNASRIKMADLLHNITMERLAKLTRKEQDGMLKYHFAYSSLKRKYGSEKRNMDIQKIKIGIIGHAVGDALGVPHEFEPRRHLQYNPVIDIQESLGQFPSHC